MMHISTHLVDQAPRCSVGCTYDEHASRTLHHRLRLTKRRRRQVNHVRVPGWRARREGLSRHNP